MIPYCHITSTVGISNLSWYFPINQIKLLLREDSHNLCCKILINLVKIWKTIGILGFLYFLRKFDFQGNSQNTYNWSYSTCLTQSSLLKGELCYHYPILLFCYSCTHMKQKASELLIFLFNPQPFSPYTEFPNSLQTCFTIYHVKSPPSHTLAVKFLKLSCTLVTFRKF